MPNMITLSEARTFLADRELNDAEIDRVRERLRRDGVEVLFTYTVQVPGDDSTRRTKFTVSAPVPWEVRL